MKRTPARQPELSEVASRSRLERVPLPAEFHPLGRDQPQAIPAVPDHGSAPRDCLTTLRICWTRPFEVGLSSLGRLHDLFVTTEAVTPGQYKSRGAGVTIRYGLFPTPFGECLIGVTERGICHLGFVQSGEGDAIDELVADWKQAADRGGLRRDRPLVESDLRLGRRASGRAAAPPLRAPISRSRSGRLFCEFRWERHARTRRSPDRSGSPLRCERSAARWATIPSRC